MAGAGGKEVGRISIRVVPDLDGFREKLEAEARAAAARDVSIPIDADTSKARRKVDEFQEEKGRKVVDLDLDARGYREKLRAETRPIDQKVKISLEDRFFNNEGALDKVKKNIDRMLTNEGLEIGRAQQRLADVMRQHSGGAFSDSWDAAHRENARRDLGRLEQEIRLKPHLDEAGIEEMRLRLAHENFTAKVKIETDTAKLHNLVRSAETDLDRIFDKHLGGAGGGGGGGGFFRGAWAAGSGGFGKNMPDISPNIGGLGGGASIALIAGLVSLLGPVLSMASQLIISLPTAVAAVGLPIGVGALGFGGIKKALDDSGILKDDKGKGKNAKDKQGLGAELKEIQTQVSDVFEKGLTPVFRQIGGVIPQLARGLPFVAQGMVNMAQAVTKAVITPEFIANFDRFTNSVSTMLTNMGPGLGSFASGMMRLVTNVGDHLPGLGKWLGGLGDEFNGWVTKMSKPKNFWGKDIPNSSPLDQAVTNMKPILNEVIGFVGRLTDAGVKMAADPTMLKGVVDTLHSITNILINSLPGLNSVFKVLANGMKLIGADTHGYQDQKLWWGAPVPDKPITAPTKQNPHGFDKNGVPASINGREIDTGKFTPDFAGTMAWLNAPNKLLQLMSGAAMPGVAFGKILGWGMDALGVGGGKSNAAPAPFNPGSPVGTGVGGHKSWFGTPPQPQQFQPPKDIQPPKIEAPKPPPGMDKIWQPLIDATHKASATIMGEVNSWAGKIKGALDSAAAGAKASGLAIGTQLAAGISAGEGAAVTAAHHLADAVKGALPHSPAEHGPFSGSGWHDVFTSGTAIADQFSDGLENGYNGVIQAAQGLAAKVSDAFSNGQPLSKELKEQIKQENAAIEQEAARLRVQKDQLGKKDPQRKEIQNQLDQLKTLRDELGLKSGDPAEDAAKKKADDAAQKQQDQMAQLASGAVKSGLNGIAAFGMANVNQFEQDIGISGKGAIPTIANIGLNYLTSELGNLVDFSLGGKQKTGGDVHYHVNNIDEALAADKVQKQRSAMQSTGR